MREGLARRPKGESQRSGNLLPLFSMFNSQFSITVNCQLNKDHFSCPMSPITQRWVPSNLPTLIFVSFCFYFQHSCFNFVDPSPTPSLVGTGVIRFQKSFIPPLKGVRWSPVKVQFAIHFLSLSEPVLCCQIEEDELFSQAFFPTQLRSNSYPPFLTLQRYDNFKVRQKYSYHKTTF